MHLLIDVGNTRIKWRLIEKEYNSDEASHIGLLPDLECFIQTLNVSEVNVLLAAVNKTSDLKKLLYDTGFKDVNIIQSQKSQAGVNNCYIHTERMGVDRWLAMIAAFDQIKNRNKVLGVIVVDAGSALTIDVVAVSGEHKGGYIVPGLLMAQQALFNNTERVIQYNEAYIDNINSDSYKKLGNNTSQCVEYGLINQLVALVRQVMEEYLDYEILFTGGDGERLAGILKTGKVDKDLVLKGLWQVRN